MVHADVIQVMSQYAVASGNRVWRCICVQCGDKTVMEITGFKLLSHKLSRFSSWFYSVSPRGFHIGHKSFCKRGARDVLCLITLSTAKIAWRRRWMAECEFQHCWNATDKRICKIRRKTCTLVTLYTINLTLTSPGSDPDPVVSRHLQVLLTSELRNLYLTSDKRNS